MASCPAADPPRATAEDQFLIQIGGIIIAAILIAVITRGRLSYRPVTGQEEHPGTITTGLGRKRS